MSDPTASRSKSTPTAPAWAIPAPAAGRALLRYGGTRTRTGRRRTRHHQQPHGADGARSRRWRRCSEPCDVVLHTDSQYVRQGITEWMPNWVRRGWKTAGGDPVKNRDLWERLQAAAAAARDRLALGEGPFRRSRQRARRHAGAQRRAEASRRRGLNTAVDCADAPDHPRYRNHRPDWERATAWSKSAASSCVERRPTGRTFHRYLNPRARVRAGRAGSHRPDAWNSWPTSRASPRSPTSSSPSSTAPN